MRRTLVYLLAPLLAALAVGVVYFVNSQSRVDSAPPISRRKLPVYYVAAAGASAKYLQVADYKCDGTAAAGGDQVELQAAIDAAETDGGGIVQLSPGTFYVSKPSEATQASVLATDCTATDDTPDPGDVQISGITWDGTDSISDVATGQLYRLSAGDDEGGGVTIEQNYEWYVGTVIAVGAKTFDLRGELLETYDQTVATRLIPAVILKEGVSIIGAGQYQTYITLANEQTCDVIHTEGAGPSKWVYARLQDLTIDGNKAQQGDKVAANWNGLCNGIVFGEYSIDIELNKVSVISCKGDGMWILSPWGTRIIGGWTEANVGTGIYFGNRSVTSVWGHKMQGNSTAVALRMAKQTLISGCDITADNLDAGANHNAIRLLAGSTENSFTGNMIQSLDAAAGATAHAVLIRKGSRNAFTGNYIYVDGTKTIFKGASVATDFASLNVIVGNSIRRDSGNVVHDLTGNWQTGNVIRDNSMLSPVDELDCIYVKNTSGGTINAGSVVVLKAVAAGNEITTTTVEGDGKVCGVISATSGDNGWNYVKTRGKTIYLKVDGTDDIAVGDLLSTFSTAAIAQKAHSGHVAFAVALEAYTTDDSSGIIDALLITPRDAP